MGVGQGRKVAVGEGADQPSEPWLSAGHTPALWGKGAVWGGDPETWPETHMEGTTGSFNWWKPCGFQKAGTFGLPLGCPLPAAKF